VSSLHLLRSPPSFSAKLSNFVFSVRLFLRSRHLLLLLLRLLSFFLCSSPFFVRYIPSPVLIRFRRFLQILCADSALSLPISSIVLIFLIFFLLAFSLPQIFSSFFCVFSLVLLHHFVPLLFTSSSSFSSPHLLSLLLLLLSIILILPPILFLP